MHEVFSARLTPQPLLRVKGAAMEMLLIAMIALPVLLSVTCREAGAEPTRSDPNSTVDVDTESAGARWPAPVRLALAEPKPEDAESEPAERPDVTGTKRTFATHEPLAESDVEQVVDTISYGPLTPSAESDVGDGAGLVMVNAVGPLAWPTRTVPKSCEGGAIWSAGAAAPLPVSAEARDPVPEVALIVPEAAPIDAGENFTSAVHDVAGASDGPQFV